MKKILLIAWDFIPFSPRLGSVIRVVTLANFLYRNNYQVYIITSKCHISKYFGYEKIVDNFNIISIEDRFKYHGIKQPQNNTQNLKSETIGNKIKSNIKLIIKDFVVPDFGIFILRDYIKIASNLIENKQINNVIISSPPHSMQLIGWKLKKKFGNKINLIVDYRDSWNTRYQFTPKNFISKFLSQNLERQVLKKCDHFIYVSRPILDKITKLYSLNLEEKSCLVMNGFSDIALSIEKTNYYKPNDKLSIGYFGSLSDDSKSSKDISFLLDFIQANQNIVLSQNLEFNFYGSINIKKYDLKKYKQIHVHNNLDHKLALNEMIKMDFLLIIYSCFQDSDEVVTGKLFDYILAKKPIICIGPIDMEAKKIIKKYNLGINISLDNYDDLKNKMQNLNTLKDNFNSCLDISIFHRDIQYNKILSLLRN